MTLKRCLSGLYPLLLFVVNFFCQQLTAQTPAINSFSPGSGSPGTIVTISGTNFSSVATDNIVYFGNVRGNVISATTTTLLASVSPGADYGQISVTVNGLTAISDQKFAITFAACPNVNQATFTPGAEITGPNNMNQLCNGDLNGDGKLDLLTLSNGTGFSVFPNTGALGKIAFGTRIEVATGYAPAGIKTGDLNSDGKVEVMVVNSGEGTISILLNTTINGNISFGTKIDLITGNTPYGVDLADLDGDGKIDIIVNNAGSRTISVFKNNGTNGLISFEQKQDFNTGNTSVRYIAVADLDKDRKPDIVYTGNNSTFYSLGIIKNNSSAGVIAFQAKQEFINELNAGPVIITDFDGDGNNDIAINNAVNRTIAVFKNISTSGTIMLQPKIDFLTGSSPYLSFNVADLNGDGKPDLVISNEGHTTTVSILENISTGQAINFGSKINVDAGLTAMVITVGDYDSDGKVDLAATNSFANNIFLLRRITSQRIFLVNASKISNIKAIGLCNVSANDWANAVGNLQVAIDSALEGDQIWVAKGNYFPTTDNTGNRNPADITQLTFSIKNGVAVFGGFLGNETLLSQRINSIPATTLNGNISRSGFPANVRNVVSFVNSNTITTLDRFTIENGVASAASPGGGITMTSSSPVISNCVIKSNSSTGQGGGLYLDNSSPSILNCLIYDNNAANGGAIAINNSTGQFINCTIVKNKATGSGAGLFTTSSANPKIFNSIIWGNKGPNNTVDNISFSGSGPDVSYSIIGQQSGVFPGTGNANTNPLFVNGRNNDFAILQGSPAANSGDTTKYPVSAPKVDAMGNPRRSNSFISMGAVESINLPVTNANGILFVKMNPAEIFGDGSSWELALPELSDALLLSNANTTIRQIWIAKGSFKPLFNEGQKQVSDYNQTFAINRGISIYGGFSGNETSTQQRDVLGNETILEGVRLNNGNNDRTYNIVIINATDSTILDGLTITHGSAQYHSYGGGGILLKEGAKSRINKCRFIDNIGSGIYNFKGSCTITNCYFSGNESLYGGGVCNIVAKANIFNCEFSTAPSSTINYNGGAIYNSQSIFDIRNCDFKNNFSSMVGGAVSNDQSSGTIVNCKFVGNRTTASGGGGAISCVLCPSVTIRNCLFVKNFAQSGGAIHNNRSTIKFDNCTITNNVAYYYGGIWNGGGASATITNSISWGNFSQYDRRGDNIFDDAVNNPISTNLIVKNSLIGLESGYYPGQSNININPFFIDTAAGILNLASNSPAINAGDNLLYPGNLNADVDANFNARLNGDRIDLGALEYGVTVCTGGDASLQSNLVGTSYQWQQKIGTGFIDINDGSNFTGSSAAILQLKNLPVAWNNALYRCLVDGNSSTIYTIGVNPGLVPSAGITVNNSSICAGDDAIFTAAPVNAGTAPKYQWQLNGIDVGPNHHTFISSALQTGDQVKVIVTNNATCPVSQTATSNVLTITVKPVKLPNVSIIPPVTAICNGVPVTLGLVATNGGTSPGYQWWRNGKKVGINSDRYTESNFNNGDLISVTMISNENCAKPVSIQSASTQLIFGMELPPSIKVTGNTVINRGQSTQLNANLTNVSGYYTLQWQDSINANGWKDIVEATVAGFSYAPLQSGVKLRCVITGTNACGYPMKAFSDPVVFTVNEVTAIEPLSPEEYGIQYFPNPVNERLTIDKLRLSDGWTTIEVVNANGSRVIAPVPVNNRSKLELNLSTLRPGLHFAIIRSKKVAAVYIRFMKI